MTTAQATKRFEMVAVPQPKSRSSAKTSYAIGVRSTQAGAAYVLGADGPEHRPVEKLYFTAGDKEFLIDVAAETLTVADKAMMRVTIFPIDINAMSGHVIEHGEMFTVVLADATRTERPLKVNRWVAATAPEFERETLPDYVATADSIAVSISATIEEATRSGNIKTHDFEVTPNTPALSKADATVQPVIDLRDRAAIEGVGTGAVDGEVEIAASDETAELDLDNDGSVKVIVPDPVTGARYIGRQWRKNQAKKDALTLAALKAAEFRVVVLEMDNGKSATIALNDANGLPVMSITSKPGKPQIDRYLTADTWNERFGPGTSLHFRTHSTLDGQPAPERGDLSTAPISRVTTTADFVRDASKVANVEVTDALARHRKLVAASTKRHDQSLVRNICR